RSVDAVVVGERERRVAELGCLYGELFRQRRAVEERVRRVHMELDIRDLGFAFAPRPRRGAALRAAANERKALLLARPMRELGLELDRHTRREWKASCSDPARAKRSSTAGSC